MRATLNLWLVSACATALLVGTAEAQQPVARRSAPAYQGADRAEPDLLSPYAPSSPRGAAVEKGVRPYRRTPAPGRTPAPEADRVPPAVSSRGVGNYFPGMRAGQFSNSNVINPRSLCVPGRRAMVPLRR